MHFRARNPKKPYFFGVAGPSVCRDSLRAFVVTSPSPLYRVSTPGTRFSLYAEVAELVDARDLGSRAARRVGSSPTFRTPPGREPAAGLWR